MVVDFYCFYLDFSEFTHGTLEKLSKSNFIKGLQRNAEHQTKPSFGRRDLQSLSFYLFFYSIIYYVGEDVRASTLDDLFR